jgi:hypothetical protein
MGAVNDHTCPPAKVIDDPDGASITRVYPTRSVCGMPQVFDKPRAPDHTTRVNWNARFGGFFWDFLDGNTLLGMSHDPQSGVAQRMERLSFKTRRRALPD